MTHLWSVGDRAYVISDGPAGAAYLAAESYPGVDLGKEDEKVILLKEDIEHDFKPRVVSQEAAKRILDAITIDTRGMVGL